MRHVTPPSPARRRLLAGSGAALGLGALPGTASFAQNANPKNATPITVADPGGVYTQGFSEAFYKPFRQAGYRLTNIARDAEPTSQVKAMVEARSVIWDVVSVSRSSYKLLSSQGLLEPLEISGPEWDQLIPAAREVDYLGTNVYAVTLGFNTETMKNHPRSWADFYNVRDFPGRRSLPRNPIHTLEGALLADGVAPSELYPLDVERAFAKLDEIKPHVAIWWTSFPQSAQLLQSGEVDILMTSNARIQALIDADSPLEILWNGGFYNLEGWVIPKGGRNVETARQFVAFCANGERQAKYTDVLAYGPTNPQAFASISPERARLLPTEPDNLSTLTLINDDWWGVHKDEMFARYSAWLLK